MLETPDIIVLTETRHNIENILNYYFPEYTHYITYPKSNKCGGVAILIKKNYLPYIMKRDLEINNDQIENVVLEINTFRKSVILSGLYRHPNNNINSFTSLVNAQIERISKKNIYILAGDINIDLRKTPTDTVIMNFVNKLKSKNITELISAPTRITNNSKTLIDHIYVSCFKKQA